MAVSVGMDSETYISKPLPIVPGQDYGYDPVGDGKVKMVPSGKVVSLEEGIRILKEIRS